MDLSSVRGSVAEPWWRPVGPAWRFGTPQATRVTGSPFGQVGMHTACEPFTCTRCPVAPVWRGALREGAAATEEPNLSFVPTVEAVIRRQFGDPGSARSDPAKVAQAILRLADEKQPPVHLLLGSNAAAAASA